MIFDPLYIIIVSPAILLALWAQMRVKSAFEKYQRVRAMSGLTGAQAAAEVLRSADIRDVKIESVQGFLSDHYDPRSKTLRLSPGVYNGQSVAAVGIAAHEAGHAVQHARGYAPLGLRNLIVPVASFGSWLAWPMIIGGVFLQAYALVNLGIVLFGGMVVFQVITLPVEFNASSRAKAMLLQGHIISTKEEMDGVSAVLGAAAWTYVAAAVTAVLQLIYFLLRARR